MILGKTDRRQKLQIEDRGHGCIIMPGKMLVILGIEIMNEVDLHREKRKVWYVVWKGKGSCYS